MKYRYRAHGGWAEPQPEESEVGLNLSGENGEKAIVNDSLKHTGKFSGVEGMMDESDCSGVIVIVDKEVRGT